ncbi:hypothetical protein [Mycolicibacterium baixiangningiae]|uniref:hypothetical protein n=1 Tax=Mycolicibacterium baixiangningiae TaxID=2761578 RepID=UPI0018D135F3|nr:hypothetical protein [Mycolicibacterium baixiangningiae]
MTATQVVCAGVDLPAVERDVVVTGYGYLSWARADHGMATVAVGRIVVRGSVGHRRRVTPVLERELMNAMWHAPSSSRTINEPLLPEKNTMHLVVTSCVRWDCFANDPYISSDFRQTLGV